MRVYVLIILVAVLAVYAWRNWFFSLCGLIVLGAFIRHPDMPTMVMGIQGANPWNLLFASIVLAWLVRRLSTPGRPRMVPLYVKVAASLYVVIIVIAFARGYTDLSGIQLLPGDTPINTPSAFISEFLIDSLKYVVVAVLLFDGARTRKDLLLAAGAVIVHTVALAFMTIRYVPISELGQAGTTEQAESAFRTNFQQDIGFHSNDIGLVLVAGLWALAAVLPLLWRLRWWWKSAALAAVAVIALAIGLTNSRASYLATVVLGLLIGALRWRKLLLLAPVAAIVVCLASPAISTRLGLGWGEVSASGDESVNWDSVSAGRTTNIWPPTIEQIGESPVTGEGRLTILRTPMFLKVTATEGSCPAHPHNAYLEVLLDSGVVGLAIVLAVFVGFPVLAFAGRARGDPVLESVTYAGLAGAAAILVMGISGQSFWPREAVDVILYLYAIMLAAYVTGKCEPAPNRISPASIPNPADSRTSPL